MFLLKSLYNYTFHFKNTQIHVRIAYLFFQLPHKGVESNGLPRDSEEIKSYFNSLIWVLPATFKSCFFKKEGSTRRGFFLEFFLRHITKGYLCYKERLIMPKNCVHETIW